MISHRIETDTTTNLCFPFMAYTPAGAGFITPEFGVCWVISALMLTSTFIHRNTSETHTQSYLMYSTSYT